MKTKTIFSCQSCGYQSFKWVGKCPGCEDWNTLVEEREPSRSNARTVNISDQQPTLISDVTVDEKQRYITGFEEFDNVMGGGVVPGSVTLIGGDPGIGKSTLSLQIAYSLARRKLKILYVSGEESVKQTKLRAQRITEEEVDNLFIVNQIDLNVIAAFVDKLKPDILIIDSIQVVFNPDLTSAPGSVSQVRECASMLTNLAKGKNISLFIIGHVTKDGMLAGPKVLEHVVDTVLYFEGERYSIYRILRAIKNRFGSTNEIGVFEMTQAGLIQVSNPSEIFLAERPHGISGSVVVPILEGTRPFLVEIQGLVSRASFGMVRQKSQGFDQNRLALLVAVLEKRLGLNLGDQDIFLNVVGGVKIVDPAADLGVSLAIASAFLDKSINFDTAVVGEVGLAAEIRSVSNLNLRVKEAQKLGFKKCVIPKNNLKSKTNIEFKGIEIIAVENLKQVLEIIKN